MPESWRIFGDWSAPAQRMISLSPRNSRGIPLTVQLTPTARVPSKTIRATVASVMIVRFALRLIGARKARAALMRWPCLIVAGKYPMPSCSIPLRSSRRDSPSPTPAWIIASQRGPPSRVHEMCKGPPTPRVSLSPSS